MYAVTGSPVEPFCDAVLTRLLADAALVALVGGATAAQTRVVSALQARSRTDRPYVILGLRGLDPGSLAMQKDGGQVFVVLDTYSDKNGPHETLAMQTRIRALFARDTVLTLEGYEMYAGSLAFEEDQVMDDFDPDMPERSGYHGVQRLVADVEGIS